MKKLLRILGLAMVGLGTLMGSAMALPTALELGTVLPGSPASEGDETARLTTLVNAYNAGLTGTLTDAYTGAPGYVYTLVPAAGVPAAPNLPSAGTNLGHVDAVNGPQTGLQIDLSLGGYGYALVKWGNVDEFYYIGNLTGAVVFNNDVNSNGESHYALFGTGTPTQVPDGGNTFALLGMAALGMIAVTRMVHPTSIL
jgi:hypothetical protein